MSELDKLMEELRVRVNDRARGALVAAGADTPASAPGHTRPNNLPGGPRLVQERPSFERLFRAIGEEIENERARSDAVRAADTLPAMEELPVDLTLGFDLPVINLRPAQPDPFPILAIAPRRKLIEIKDLYDVEEFFAFEDGDFVRSAYLGLLGREPDQEGYVGYLEPLRGGQISKLNILWHIIQSSEGRARAVEVRGLRRALRFEKLRTFPVVRYWFALIQAFIALARLPRKVAALEGRWSEADSELRRGLAQNWHEVQDWLQGARAARDVQIAELARASTTRYALESLVARLVDTGVTAAQTARRLADLSEQLNEALSKKMSAEEFWTAHSDLSEQLNEALSKKMSAEEFWTAHSQTIGRVGMLSERVDRESQLLGATIDAVKATIGDRLGVAERHFKSVEENATRSVEELRQGLERAGQELSNLQRKEASRAKVLSRVDREQQDAAQRLGELARIEAATAERLAQLTAFVDEGTDLTHSIPDEFYFEFEDRFRGTNQDIKNRVSVYVPIVTGVGAGVAQYPVLDIGCGRGEWLEVLREKGLEGFGVDLNQSMVDFSVARGLQVTHAEALEFLRKRPAQSLGAVTGIHVVEHVTFGRVLALLDACRVALKPGGVVIFETPNPENVTVGSCNFWYDPTHRAPLPPEMMRWVALSSGFARVEILRLHPVPPDSHLSDGNEAVRTMLNERFNGPQDYALIAYTSES